MQHHLHEQYGDYYHRRGISDYSLPALAALLFIFGIISFIGGLREGDFGTAIIRGGVFILIAIGLHKIWKRKQHQLNKYGKRRQAFGAPIHDSY